MSSPFSFVFLRIRASTRSSALYSMYMGEALAFIFLVAALGSQCSFGVICCCTFSGGYPCLMLLDLLQSESLSSFICCPNLAFVENAYSLEEARCSPRRATSHWKLRDFYIRLLWLLLWCLWVKNVEVFPFFPLLLWTYRSLLASRSIFKTGDC